MRITWVFLLVVLALLLPMQAWAGDNDFKLHRLSSCLEGTTPGDTCIADPDIDAFKAFSKNMGLIFAPSFLAPSESLGQAGFSFGFETKFAAASKGDYWRALNGVGPDGDQPPIFSMLQLHGRKGLPFSFEIDAEMSWLVESELIYLGGGLKWAISEGFAYIPDLAVRGHGGTVTGAPDMNLSNAGVDVSLSKDFGIGGVVNLTPYAGYSHIWVISSSRVLDADPGYSRTPSGSYAPEFVFSQETQSEGRGFFGFRLGLDYFSFTFESAIAADVQTYGLNLGASF